tara:strand:+ start:10436 stop:10918 length:483 start_codon:yes stop_codon:yes gene_type:complete
MSKTPDSDPINNLFVRKNADQNIDVTELGRELGVAFTPKPLYRSIRPPIILPDYEVDDITFTVKHTDEEINEMCQLILRQTDLTLEVIKDKLIEYDYNTTDVIKEYMGIKPKKKREIKSIHQEIYRQMRLKLDAATKDFNDKQYEKIKKEWEEDEKNEKK